MKMAVVGCEASGKTVFMCALADYFGRDSAGDARRLRLTPENAAANSFECFQFRQMRCLRQWPPATPPGRAVEIKWALRRNGDPVADIGLMEFGGETFRAAFRDTEHQVEHDKATTELLQYLGDADFFVVLVSLKSLLADPLATSPDAFDRETEAIWVTRGILDFVRKNRPNAGLVIGLTQADRYQEELAAAGGAQQLFAARWPTVAAAAARVPVVEVASVSKTDEAGNPAESYSTNGILPVMRIFAKRCLGDENALEDGRRARPPKKATASRVRNGVWTALSALCLGLIAFLLVPGFRFPLAGCMRNPAAAAPAVIERIVTNNVETILKVPVTNTIEKVVLRPVTNTIEKVVERIVTNAVPAGGLLRSEAELQREVPPGYRIWTDYRGQRIIARWTGVAHDESGITIVTRYGRKIEGVLWKFSEKDQTYVRDELKRHNANGEVMDDGRWIRNPLLKSK